MDEQREKLNTLSLLIVDDDEFILDAMHHLMRRRVKNVDAAHSGKEALALFRTNAYDLIITDIEMPDMNGYELYDAITKSTPATKFIFLSGHDAMEVEEKFRSTMIAKPLDKEKLLDMIVSLF